MMESEQSGLRFSTKVLRQLMEHVASQRDVFTLLVSDAPNEKVVYFANGGFRLLSSGDRAVGSVENFLLRNGRLEVSDLHEVLEACRRKGRSFKEILVEQKLLSAEEYRAVVDKLVEDELYDLVFWEDAWFSCYSGSPPQEIYGRDSKALVAAPDCRRLAENVTDWIDRWDRVRGKLFTDRARVRVKRRGVFALEKLTDEEHTAERRVLELALQETDLRSLWFRSGLELPEVCEHVARFADKRWVEVTRPETPQSSPEQLAEEIARLEDGIDRVIGRELVRQKLIQLYRRAGRHAEAVAGLVSLADSALSKAQWPIAAEQYKEALALAPKDLDLLEKLLSLQLKQHLEREAFRTANLHAQRLVEQGDAETARGVGKLLRRLAGSTVEADSLLAAISASSGDTQEAVEQYLAIVEEHERQGRRREAIQLLRQAIKTCQGAERLVARLAELDPSSRASHGGADADRRTRQRAGARPRLALVVLLIVAAVLGGLHLSGILPLDELWSSRKPSASAASESEAGAKGFKLQRAARALIDPTAPEAGEVSRAPFPVEGRSGVDLRSLFGIEDDEETESNRNGDGDETSETTNSESAPTGNSGQSLGPAGVPVPTPRAREAQLPPGKVPAQGPAPAVAPQGALPLLPLDGQAGFVLLPHQAPADWQASVPLVAPDVWDKLLWTAEQNGLQRPEIRVLEAELVVIFADGGPAIGLDPRTGEQRFTLEARGGSRWAFAHRGMRICRWEPGRHALVYNTVNGRRRATSWRVPEGTEALAIGVDGFAVRRADLTTLYSEDGRLLREALFHRWREGVFVDDWLILAFAPDNSGAGGLWVIHAPSWIPVWCWRNTSGPWTFR